MVRLLFCQSSWLSHLQALQGVWIGLSFNRRLMAGLLVLLMLGASGFMPTDTPRAPDEWGEPFATENPYAPPWPSSQQYTWVFVEPMDQPILRLYRVLSFEPSSNTIPFLQVESSIWISSLLGMQVRMRQTIDLVDERVPIRMDSEAFRLDQKGDAIAHVPPSSGDVELNVWVYDCYTTSGTDPDGTNVGEVVVVGQSNWGDS